MADDSWDIDINMNFHQCDIPHGMKDYVLKDVTPEQQLKLNERKREQIRTDQKYLADHPEIRAIIVMILRMLLKTRPKFDIFESIGRYFMKSSVDIQEEVINYLKDREEILAMSSKILEEEDLLDTGFIYEEEDEEEESKRMQVEEAKKEKEEEKQKEEEKEENIVTDITSSELLILKTEGLVVVHDADIADISKEDIEYTTSAERVCHKLLGDIIDAVIEEIEIPSLASITSSSAFPVDYEDHAFGSADSILGSDEDEDD